MPVQLLHGADVRARFEQMRRERVAQGVATGALGDPGACYGGLDGTLENAFVNVVSAVLARSRLDAET